MPGGNGGAGSGAGSADGLGVGRGGGGGALATCAGGSGAVGTTTAGSLEPQPASTSRRSCARLCTSTTVRSEPGGIPAGSVLSRPTA